MRRVLVVFLVGVAVLTVPASASAAISITKIQYDPPGSDTGSNINQEDVVIKNKGSNAISLKSWTLKDQANHRYTFGTFELGAGNWVTIHTGKGQRRPERPVLGIRLVHLEQRWRQGVPEERRRQHG